MTGASGGGDDELRVVIDHREGGFLVVSMDDGRSFELPEELLPSGVREGDVISIQRVSDGATTTLRLRVDREETNARRGEAARLVERLGRSDRGGDLNL
jgi:hypothetical protein